VDPGNIKEVNITSTIRSGEKVIGYYYRKIKGFRKGVRLLYNTERRQLTWD
jgi:hypothetical protein